MGRGCKRGGEKGEIWGRGGENLHAREQGVRIKVELLREKGDHEEEEDEVSEAEVGQSGRRRSVKGPRRRVFDLELQFKHDANGCVLWSGAKESEYSTDRLNPHPNGHDYSI